jgi:CRISPR type III-A-associated RAMP protein Csm4
MNPGWIVRFRPLGPWRSGPDSGARDRVDPVFHSDRLYSAVCSAMAQLGQLEEWLDATARNPDGPAARFSSCFPFQDELLYVIPPRSHWPPAPSLKVRWKGARFVPLRVVETVLADKNVDENRWAVDGASECLMPADRPRGPYQQAVRSHAAVDRLSSHIDVHLTACLEFREGAGLWAAVFFADESAKSAWSERLTAALRLLADSGFGGKRSWGWGRCQMPEITEGDMPGLILRPREARAAAVEEEAPAPVEQAWWLLSLFSPASADSVDWQRGEYALVTRAGRVESAAAPGTLKKAARMVAEGSVLFSDAPVSGTAVDVAPDGCPHPVYRSGYALAISIPWRVAS